MDTNCSGPPITGYQRSQCRTMGTTLILDLKVVNDHLIKHSIEYDNLRATLIFIKKLGWMMKVDINVANPNIYSSYSEKLGLAWKYGKCHIF